MKLSIFDRTLSLTVVIQLAIFDISTTKCFKMTTKVHSNDKKEHLPLLKVQQIDNELRCFKLAIFDISTHEVHENVNL